VLEQLVTGSGLAGTFAVLVGDRYRATSDRFPQAALDAALREAGADDPQAAPAEVLERFVRADDELTALGEEIAELDLDVELPGADADAKSDYAEAVGIYDRAGDELPRAESPEVLERVVAAIATGRAAMARARERLNA
jgi:hypothetical protein